MTLKRYITEAELFQGFAESDAVPDVRFYAILLGLAPKSLFERLQQFLSQYPARNAVINEVREWLR